MGSGEGEAKRGEARRGEAKRSGRGERLRPVAAGPRARENRSDADWPRDATRETIALVPAPLAFCLLPHRCFNLIAVLLFSLSSPFPPWFGPPRTARSSHIRVSVDFRLSPF